MGTGTGSIDLSTLNNLHGNLTQHFWFNSNAGAAYGTGVHITLSSQAEFIANPTGQNILMNTDGISIRNGTIPLMVLDNDSLDFNVVTDLTQGTYSNVATFGATGFRMGVIKDGETRLVANGSGIDLIRRVDDDNQNLDVTLAHFGYDYGTPEQSGQPQVQNPYYTFGYRSPNYNVGNWSVAEGDWTVASGFASHAEGAGTKATDTASHAEGFGSEALNRASHAEGWYTKAGSLEGGENQGFSHAEGRYTEAIGYCSHAEGDHTIAGGGASHSEGNLTEAKGFCAHAEGNRSIAYEPYSHVQNYYTVATERFQTVIGKRNKVIRSGSGTDEDPYVYSNAGDYAFVVGNGSGDSTEARSNAYAIDWDGNVKAGGKYYSGCSSDSSGTAYIGQVFNWQGNLKSNLTANADAYVEGNGSITLKGGHTYLILAYVGMTNSTNGSVNRRVQIFNKTANTSFLAGSKFVASQAWGTVETQTLYDADQDVTLTVRGAASRPTTTIPTAWIRAVCIA